MSAGAKARPGSVASGVSLDAWLNAHGFDCSKVERRLRQVEAPRVEAPREDLNTIEAEPGLPLGALQTCFHRFVVPAVSSFLHLAPHERMALDNVAFSTLKGPTPPFTMDPGPGWPPRIVIRWSGSVADLMCLAHETGHALQIILSNHQKSPPVLREICAFLTEYALMRFASERDERLHRALLQVWNAEQVAYLGMDLKALLNGIESAEATYTYRWNYPLARIAAPLLAHRLKTQTLKAFFADPGLGGALMRAVLFEPSSIEAGAVWDSTVDELASILPDKSDRIERAARQIVANLWPGVSRSVVSRGSHPPILTCPVNGTPDDKIHLGAALGSALALPQRDKQTRAPVSEGIGRALFAGATLEANHIARRACAGLSAPALGDVLMGDADADWLSTTEAIRLLDENGTFAEPSTAQSSAFVQWRSLGIRTLAALSRGEGNVLSGVFLDRCREDTDPLAKFAPLARPGPDAATALGCVVHQLAGSPYHSQFTLAEYLPTEIFPAFAANQLTVFCDPKGRPLGFVTWAWVTKNTEARVHRTGQALSASDWTAGDRVFFNDWITEPPAMRPVVHLMRNSIFPDHIGTSLRRNQDRSVRRINRWTGVNRRTSEAGQPPKSRSDIGCRHCKNAPQCKRHTETLEPKRLQVHQHDDMSAGDKTPKEQAHAAPDQLGWSVPPQPQLKRKIKA